MENMVIIGIMCIGPNVDMDHFYYDRLKSLTDKTLVLLDNCNVDIDADYKIHIDSKNPIWNDAYNRSITTLAASQLGAKWTLTLDTDENLDHRLVNRNSLLQLIDIAESKNCNAVRFFLRELWGNHHYYRSDGIWGKKRRARLVKNYFSQEAGTINVNFINDGSFHGPTFAHNESKKLKVYESPYEIYHYGCFTEDRRIDRVKKYTKLDPYRQCQPYGYEYMVEYSNIEVSHIHGLPIKNDNDK